MLEHSVLDYHLCFHVPGRRGCHCFVHGAAPRNPLHHRPRFTAACCWHRVPKQCPLCALNANSSVPVYLPRLRLHPEGPGLWSDQIRWWKPARPSYCPSGLQDPADHIRQIVLTSLPFRKVYLCKSMHSSVLASVTLCLTCGLVSGFTLFSFYFHWQ